MGIKDKAAVNKQNQDDFPTRKEKKVSEVRKCLLLTSFIYIHEKFTSVTGFKSQMSERQESIIFA